MLRRCVRHACKSFPKAPPPPLPPTEPVEGLTRYPDLSAPGIVRGLDYLGTVCFAISGSLTAAAADMDLFGCTVVGTITALGGGTIRDVIFGRGPVFWLSETEYFSMAVAFACATFLGCYFMYGGELSKWPLHDTHPLMFCADTLGIGAFCVIGTMSAIRSGYGVLICLFSGVITSTGGGMIRDTLCKRPVRVLHSYSEIYATTALCGSATYLAIRAAKGPFPMRIVCGAGVAMGLRVYASTYHTILPTLHK